MDLGTKIRNIRYNHNMSQEEMSKVLEINRNYLSRIETNKSLPTSEVLTKLSDRFNVNINSLLGLNLDGSDGEKTKIRKIKKINQYCSYLSNSELDFVVNILAVMSNNTKI